MSQLISVDHSCACQKLFNVAIWDVKDKLSIWGEEFVYKIAFANKNVTQRSDNTIKGLSTTDLLNLCYKAKFLTFEQWELVTECYQIRCKLEHEDRYYEVNSEETKKLFAVCINDVINLRTEEISKFEEFEHLSTLSRIAVPSQVLVQSFSKSSSDEQVQALQKLIALAIQPMTNEYVKQNSKFSLIYLAEHITDEVKRQFTTNYNSETILEVSPDLLDCLTFVGVLFLISPRSKPQYYETVYRSMDRIGVEWFKGLQHVEILRSFTDLGGLNNCPDYLCEKILRWLTLTYIGQSESEFKYISDRNVFFSSEAAPIIAYD